ncbi:hypothetical protein [Paenibacillus agilis]|uniref:Uncharacterized protein n=1 Tax=Paenibacillus agilis TaxID=3020863 RepID=A0A559IYV0_9BACL|nr:hypothetical protein [Paenibacillus agilis]TVX92814.1 hypothetical protein FPZ44_06950 [Paenibacillus agilis]
MNRRRKQNPYRRSRRDQRNGRRQKEAYLHNNDGEGKGPYPPGPDGKGYPNKPPPIPPITLQKAVLLAAVLKDWLIVETVIINRNKTVQVILAGDFGKFGIRPEFLNEENVGLFEALEDTGLFPGLGEGPEGAAPPEAGG